MLKTGKKLQLKVRGADWEDVYKDIVRISEVTRGDHKAGRIHKFSTTEGSAYFILRGTAAENDGKILMDEAARNKLKLPASAECLFTVVEAGFWGELRWVWSATNPTYRIAGRLGVLSFGLAIIALEPLVRELVECIKHLGQ